MDMERRGQIWDMVFKITSGFAKPWPRGQSQPTFFAACVNKVLLTEPICLHFLYNCFHATMAELSHHGKTRWPANAKIFTIWTFAGKVCQPPS